MDSHQLIQLSLGITRQFIVRSGLQNDATTEIEKLVEVFQEGDAICHDDPSLGRE